MEALGQATAAGPTLALFLDSTNPDSKTTFRLDADKKPPVIELRFRVDGKERTRPGAYELKGDTLRLCWEGRGRVLSGWIDSPYLPKRFGSTSITRRASDSSVNPITKSSA